MSDNPEPVTVVLQLKGLSHWPMDISFAERTIFSNVSGTFSANVVEIHDKGEGRDGKPVRQIVCQALSLQIDPE